MYSEAIKTKDEGTFALSLMRGTLKGILFAVLITVLAFLLFSLLLAYTGLGESTIPIISVIVKILGALISGVFAVNKTEKKGFLSGIVSGSVYGIVVLLIAVLADGGTLNWSRMLVGFVVSALSGALGGILGINLGGGRNNKRRR